MNSLAGMQILHEYINLFIFDLKVSSMTNKFLKIAIMLCSIYAGFSGCTPEMQEFIAPRPIAIQGEDVRTTRFTATWQPLLGARNYILEVATDASFEEEFLIAEMPLEVQDTAYTVRNLQVANTYYYRLFANLSTGESTQYSDIIAVNTLGMPTPVADVATDIGPNQFTSRWQQVIEAKTYKIEINSDIGFAESSLVQRIITEDTFVVIRTNLEVDEDYFYRIAAQNGDIVSEFSNVVHLTTTQLTRPTVSIAPDSAQSEFTFGWNLVTGANYYTVDISTDPLFIDPTAYLVENEVTQETSFTLTNLNPNTSYYYRIRAHSDKSFSEYSEKGRVITFPLPAPVLHEASNLSATSFTTTWTSVSNVDSYTLEVSIHPDFSTVLLVVNDITDTTYSIEELAGGQRYYYRVRSNKDGSYSAYSNVMSQYLAALEQPTNLIATNTTFTSFTAAWQVVTDASYYLVDVATDSQFSSILSNYQADSISKTLINVEGLSANTEYYLRVQARSNYANSEYSETLTITTSAVAAPTAQPASGVQNREIRANWSLVPNADSYLLDVATSSSFTVFLPGYEDLSVAGTSRLVEGLLPSTSYYYRVRAVVDGNVSEYSNVVIVTTDDISVQNIPGIVEAEDFSFNDGTVQVQDNNASQGYYLGSIQQGDSVSYQINVPSSGPYTIEFRVANNSGSTTNIIVEYENKQALAFIPDDTDWDWMSVTTNVNFDTGGTKTIWLKFSGGVSELMRIDWMDIY